MIAFIKNYLQRLRDEAVSRHYGRGFEYGAAALLQGVRPELLEDETTSPIFDQSIEADAFDAGVVAACREWRGRFVERVQ